MAETLNNYDCPMTFILIDDNVSALDLIAQQIEHLDPESKPSALILVWPNTLSRGNLTDLMSTAKKLTEAGIDSSVSQVHNQQELAACFETKGSTVIVTDLNMDSVGVSINSTMNSWLNDGVLHTAVLTFLGVPSNALLIYSSILAKDVVEKGLKEKVPRARVFSLPTNLGVEPTSVKARLLVSDIKSIINQLSGTRLERLWNSPDTLSWFSSESPVPHDWDVTVAEGPDYRNSILNGFGVQTLPDEIWTASFHESLKGIAGAHFVGSPLCPGVSKDKSLLLGSVAIIAMLACDIESTIVSQFVPLFCAMDPIVAQKPFLRIMDSWRTHDVEVAEASSIALFWVFRKCLNPDLKHGSLRSQRVDLLSDGFSIFLKWDPRPMFVLAQGIRFNGLDGGISERGPAKKFSPSNSKHAVADLMLSLAYHPGRVLPGNSRINIQAVTTP
jgi:hypothetical protein